MHRILRFLLALFGLLGTVQALAQTPTPLPVTGNLTQILGTPAPYAGVTFQLYNCPSPVVITGTSVIVQTSMQVQANASGLVNASVWPNDKINCNLTTGNSQYRVTYVVNGVPTGTPACFQVVSTQGVWNLNSQQPVSCGTTPPSPQDGNFVNVSASGNINAATATIPVVTGHASLDVPITTTVNSHALSSNVVLSASDLTTGTLPHAQLPALLSADIPNNTANTTGTSGGLTGSPDITVHSCTGCGLIADVSVTIPSITIPANTCYGAAATTTATLFTMAGVTTSKGISAQLSGDPSGLTGYGSTGGLSIKVWPSAANVGSYKVCNSSAGTITSGGITVVMVAQ